MISFYFSFLIIFINNQPHIKENNFFYPTVINKVVTWNSRPLKNSST